MKQFKSATMILLIIFATISMTAGTVSAATAGVILTTDKSTYSPGETIKITVKNNLNQPIYFNAIMIKTPTGKIIDTECPVVCTLVYNPIRVNSYRTFTKTWTLSSAGSYWIYVNWWTEGSIVRKGITGKTITVRNVANAVLPMVKTP